MSATAIANSSTPDSNNKGSDQQKTTSLVYRNFMPPCNNACPVEENIQGWMKYAQAGNYFEAFQTLMEDCPFPAIMGRICAAPCEKKCNRSYIDTTVNIHAVERFIGDEAIRNKWQPEFNVVPTGKKVLVIGAGPGGLSAAYHLTRFGHQVDVYDAGSLPGGLLRSGIPRYHLPKDILDAEIERLAKMGINIRQNYTVQDIEAEKENGNYDAVYLSTGAQIIKEENVNYDDSVHLTDAFSFFKEANLNSGPFIQKRVVIYGGGKLALYIARMIKRFGSEATIFFCGNKKIMPAHDYEINNALDEGVKIHLLRCVRRIEKKEITLEKMKMDNGQLTATGKFTKVPADIFINANRQEADTAYLSSVKNIRLNNDGTVIIDAHRMTGAEGIFAGGDMLFGKNPSAAIAIGHGKKAANFINAFLLHQPYETAKKLPISNYQNLHMWNVTKTEQQTQKKITPDAAAKSFEEVNTGLSEKQARLEAQRCLSCNHCIESD